MLIMFLYHSHHSTNTYTLTPLTLKPPRGRPRRGDILNLIALDTISDLLELYFQLLHLLVLFAILCEVILVTFEEVNPPPGLASHVTRCIHGVSRTQFSLTTFI